MLLLHLGNPTFWGGWRGSLLEIALACFKVALTFWGRRLLRLGGRPCPCSHSLSLCAPPQRPKGHLLYIRIPVTLNPVVETNPPVYCLAYGVARPVSLFPCLRRSGDYYKESLELQLHPNQLLPLKCLEVTLLHHIPGGDRQVAIDTCHTFRDS